MPQRDYIARSKKKGGMSKSTMLSMIVVLIVAGGIGLWLLKENAPAPVIPAQQTVTQPTPHTQKPSSNLPSRPEEVYSYIRDLESREVITDGSQKTQEKLAQLSKEQLQQLEEKRKQEEAARLAAEKPAQPEPQTTTTVEQAPAQPTLTPEQLAAQKAQEQKAAEEKRKQAELKKQQELAKKAEQAKQAETAKAAEKAKTEAVKKAESSAKETTTVKTAEKAPAAAGRFGLQCGAFKNKAQAENMQARLVMSGFNARIASSGEWNRVFVGPIGDRAAASTAQSNARSVAECLIVTM